MTILREGIFLITLSLVELIILPMPLSFIVLLLWAQFQNEVTALSFGFALGFLFDIFLLRPFGTTSIIFLTIIFITILYKRKFQPTNMLFLGLVTLLSLFVLEFTYRASFTFFIPFAYAILTVILARIFFKGESRYELGDWVS